MKNRVVLVGRVLKNNKLVGGKFVGIGGKRCKFIRKQDFNKLFEQCEVLNCKFENCLRSTIKSVPLNSLNVYNENKKLIKIGYDEEWVISTVAYSYTKKISGALNSGAIYDPESKEAEEHAAKYYGLIRSRKDDVGRIAKRTNLPQSTIQKIKDYVFIDEHDLGGKSKERFAPDCAMAQSWQRLIGDTLETIQDHDILLIQHELEEMKLVESGMSQSEAHDKASEKYNYSEASNLFYKNKSNRREKR